MTSVSLVSGSPTVMWGTLSLPFVCPFLGQLK